MKDYLLILRDQDEQWDRFSPEEMKAVIDRFAAWNRRLQEEDRFVDAGKLSGDLGNTVRMRGGELVVDGPFSEAKEAIAGYFCIRAETPQAANEIAKGCPILTYGGSVEVREMVKDECAE